MSVMRREETGPKTGGTCLGYIRRGNPFQLGKEEGERERGEGGTPINILEGTEGGLPNGRHGTGAGRWCLLRGIERNGGI